MAFSINIPVILVIFAICASSISIDKAFSILTRKPVPTHFDRIVSVNSNNEAKCGFNTNNAEISLTNYMRLPVAQYACVKVAKYILC